MRSLPAYFLVITLLCGCGGTVGTSTTSDNGTTTVYTKIFMQNDSDSAVNMWINNERIQNDNLVAPGAYRTKSIDIQYTGSGGMGSSDGFTIYIGRDGRQIKRETHSSISFTHPRNIMATYHQSGEITYKEAP